MTTTKANRRAGDAAAQQISKQQECSKSSLDRRFPQEHSRDLDAAVTRSRSRTSMADAMRAALQKRGR